MLERPGTELAVIPGCGHAPALMSLSQTSLVARFLARERDAHAEVTP